MTIDGLRGARATRSNARLAPRTLVGVIGTACSVAGICIAAYLTVAHYTSSTTLACPEHGVVNCEKVTTSSYAVVFGVPVAVAGLAYFVVMTVLQLPGLWARADPVLRVGRVVVAAGGMAFVLWLLYAELFRLDAICLWCTAVHVLVFVVFVTTMFGTAIVAPSTER